MDKLRIWLNDFMQGRYGYDEMSRGLLVGVIVLLILSVVCNLLGHVLGGAFYVLSNVLNALGFLLVIYIFFRVFSKNHEKRAEENRKFMKRQKKARNQKDYKYLSCPHCKQEMRVPRGKGKIAVKCPKCGENTIIKS